MFQVGLPLRLLCATFVGEEVDALLAKGQAGAHILAALGGDRGPRQPPTNLAALRATAEVPTTVSAAAAALSACDSQLRVHHREPTARSSNLVLSRLQMLASQGSSERDRTPCAQPDGAAAGPVAHSRVRCSL